MYQSYLFKKKKKQKMFLNPYFHQKVSGQFLVHFNNGILLSINMKTTNSTHLNISETLHEVNEARHRRVNMTLFI